MRSWAVFFPRVVLGLIFGMAGFYKCFTMTPLGHARKLFVEPFSSTWIPTWLLWTSGTTIPVIELAAGWLLVLGWRTREAIVILGFVLVMVTYGHLLQNPLYNFMYHVIPRLGLLVFVAWAGPDHDQFSMDSAISQRRQNKPIARDA